jgi:hypothetical protein
VTWYALPGGYCGRTPAQLVEDVAEAIADDLAWTVSRHPIDPGWKTIGGIRSYGLSKQEADFLAAAANEKEAREGAVTDA